MLSDQRRAQSLSSAAGSLGAAVGDFSVLGGYRSLSFAGADGRSGRGRSSQRLPRGHEASHTHPAEPRATEYVEINAAANNATAANYANNPNDANNANNATAANTAANDATTANNATAAKDANNANNDNVLLLLMMLPLLIMLLLLKMLIMLIMIMCYCC